MLALLSGLIMKSDFDRIRVMISRTLLFVLIGMLSACACSNTIPNTEQVATWETLSVIVLPEKKFKDTNPDTIVNWIYENAKNSPRAKRITFSFNHLIKSEDYIVPTVSMTFRHATIIEAINSLCKITTWKYRISGTTIHIYNSTCMGR